MTPCYILKQTFTKVNLLNYPNNLRGGAITQTGLPQNSISTSPSPITMTPCYILKRTFTKAQQFGGGAISQTGLPQNSISTSPSPITMAPCYILKRTFTKVNLLNYPNNFGGGCFLANRITTKLHLHFPLPHYNDTVQYSKTNFYKSQPPQLPQQFGGVLSRKPDYHKTPSPLPSPPLQWHRAIFQNELLQKSTSSITPTIGGGGCFLANRITTKLHLHFPLPHYNDTVLYSKTNFYKNQPPQLPQQFGGVLSCKPDHHKTLSPLPPPPLQ